MFIPPVGATQAFTRLLGRSRALRYLYEGASVAAEEAFKMGLVDVIRPPERLHKEFQALIVRIKSQLKYFILSLASKKLFELLIY